MSWELEDPGAVPVSGPWNEKDHDRCARILLSVTDRPHVML